MPFTGGRSPMNLLSYMLTGVCAPNVDPLKVATQKLPLAQPVKTVLLYMNAPRACLKAVPWVGMAGDVELTGRAAGSSDRRVTVSAAPFLLIEPHWPMFSLDGDPWLSWYTLPGNDPVLMAGAGGPPAQGKKGNLW